jgi:hypothetical protein
VKQISLEASVAFLTTLFLKVSNSSEIKYIFCRAKEMNEIENKRLWEETLLAIEDPPPEKAIFCDGKNARLTLVLIEFREHPLIEKVLHNLAWVYGGLGDVALSVVCGRSNASYVKRFQMKNMSIHVKEEVDNVDIRGYNEIMTSPSFYRLFSSPMILVVQTDTITRHAIPERFYYDYEYVGAPWVGPQINGPEFRVVGNGGYSLRSVHAMIEICESVKYDGEAEDLFFSKHTRKVAPLDEASKFSVEHVFHEDPCGLHQAWRFHSRSRLEHLLKPLKDFASSALQTQKTSQKTCAIL